MLVGMRELSLYEQKSAPPVDISIENFVHSRPQNVNHFKLKDIRPGANVYPAPVRKDGEWEKVYVCLFSKNTYRLPKNYFSVIVELDGVNGREQLGELLSRGELEVYYWPDDQELPSEVYNRMAFKYRGMHFARCLLCKSGGPPPSPDYGNNCMMVGFIGFILSFVGVVGYYCIRLLLSVIYRERDPWYDEDDDPVTNRAGLPALQVAPPRVPSEA